MKQSAHFRPYEGPYPWYKMDRNGGREVMELARVYPPATILMGVLLQRLGRGNGVTASHAFLAEEMGVKSTTTVKKAIKVLVEHSLIEVWRPAERGGVNSYMVSRRVAWVGRETGKRRAEALTNVMFREEDQDRGKVDRARSLPPLVELHEVPEEPEGDPQLDLEDWLARHAAE